jgi:osmotically-inducible protein OsmY
LRRRRHEPARGGCLIKPPIARPAAARALCAAVVLSLSACVPLLVGTAVVGTASVATDRRSVGAQLDDEVIEDKSKTALVERFQGEQFHITVTSFNAVVLITGEVPTEAAKAEAGELVRKTPKVRAVQNELMVGPVADIQQRTNDTFITSKVKARFIEAERFPLNLVKVVTERGTVYLMGIVRREEGDAATEIARTTEGVQRVVKVFEYIS